MLTTRKMDPRPLHERGRSYTTHEKSQLHRTTRRGWEQSGRFYLLFFRRKRVPSHDKPSSIKVLRDLAVDGRNFKERSSSDPGSNLASLGPIHKSRLSGHAFRAGIFLMLHLPCYASPPPSSRPLISPTFFLGLAPRKKAPLFVLDPGQSHKIRNHSFPSGPSSVNISPSSPLLFTSTHLPSPPPPPPLPSPTPPP